MFKKENVSRNMYLALLISLMTISFVFAAQGNAEEGQGLSVNAGLSGAQIEQDSNGEIQNTENNNDDIQLQVEEKVRAGNYENSNGKQMKIQTENGFRFQVEGIEAKSSMVMSQEQVQNKTMLKARLSNGRDAEIKVMPNTASETAIERLRLKSCNSENNCSIELKEVGNGEQMKIAYEVKVQKESRILGMFKAKMQVQAQINAENGEVIRSKKPWWAFLATE